MARLAVSMAIWLALGGLSSSAQQFYVTQPGDNLFRIALRHGTTVEALAAANRLSFPYTIHAGTRILLAVPSASAQLFYIVQPGDSLFRIALQNGTTAEALAAANGIGPPYTVHAGLQLILSNPSDLAQQNYIVRAGDSLFSIAMRNGISVEALAAANRIAPPYIIHEGNWLTVPAPWCPEDEVMSPPAPVEEPEEPIAVIREPELPSDPLSLAPKRESKPKPNPKPEPKRQCTFVQRYDGETEIPRDAIDTLCIKECHVGAPPIPLCTERGYF